MTLLILYSPDPNIQKKIKFVAEKNKNMQNMGKCVDNETNVMPENAHILYPL
jgi:hypothetical protein